MDLAEGIRKHGFRKWYERELLQSHAHLVLTFACTVGVFAAFEAYDRRSPLTDQLGDALAVLLCGGVGIWALRRYLRLLSHAESSANQADCPRCKTYGRFQLEGMNEPQGLLRVRCRKCGEIWRIVD